MQYKGIELVEITKPQIFDPPKKMVVWDNDVNKKECIVAAILTGVGFPVTTIDELGRLDGNYSHCAEIPEEQKQRRATNRELSKWLAQGNGEVTSGCINISPYCKTSIYYDSNKSNDLCCDDINVRKWDDTEWHEPSIDYLGIK